MDTYVIPTDLYLEPTQRELELTTDQYVPFLNNSNNLLDEITSILNTSPTNRGIIQQKTTLSVGDGFLVKKGSQNTLLAALKKAVQFIVGGDELQALNEYINKVNPEGESLQQLSWKLFFDFWTYGNAFVEVIKIKTGSMSSYVQRHVPVSKCRPKKVNRRGEVEYVGVSNRWEENESNPVEVNDLPMFPNFARVEGFEGERSIIHIKSYAPGFFYWGVPDWVSAFLWGEMEYRIPKYNQSKFSNGYTPSAIVSFFGQMSQQEAQGLVDNFVDKFTNTGNNSKMFVQVLSDETMKADVQLLKDDSEGNFMQLSELARQNIVTAHRWTMSLSGMQTAGSLGSNQQIRTEFEILQNMVIKPVQKVFLSQWLNPTISDAANFLGLNFRDVSLAFKSSTPISFLGDLDVKTVLTIDEQREILGFDPIKQQTNDEPNTSK